MTEEKAPEKASKMKTLETWAGRTALLGTFILVCLAIRQGAAIREAAELTAKFCQEHANEATQLFTAMCRPDRLAVTDKLWFPIPTPPVETLPVAIETTQPTNDINVSGTIATITGVITIASIAFWGVRRWGQHIEQKAIATALQLTERTKQTIKEETRSGPVKARMENRQVK